MPGSRLGCLTSTGIIAAMATTAAIAGYSLSSGGQMFSPGALNAIVGEIHGGVTSHAEIGGNCDTCHTAPWERETMGDRCMECHDAIAIQLQDVASMHGSILHDNPDLRCQHCHPEHRGPDARLTEMTDAAFPHETVGFSLNGHQFSAAREPFLCEDCHGGDISRFDLSVCDACHRQISEGFMTAHTLSFGPACMDCHDGVDRLVTRFNHNRFQFKLAGKHTGLACDTCHYDARHLADFSSTAQECQSCHLWDEPHDGRFGLDCAECHSDEGWRPAKFDHNLSNFKLEGKHAEADCYSCHREDDEHGGSFGTDCAACHTPSDWEDATFDHNLSSFPLTGAHFGLTCEQCHTGSQFTGLSIACVSCHADPEYHAGLFGFECASCHSTVNWFTLYNGPHPGIADEGGSGVNHGGATCGQCHTSTLHTATCLACHDSNNPDHEGEGDED